LHYNETFLTLPERVLTQTEIGEMSVVVKHYNGGMNMQKNDEVGIKIESGIPIPVRYPGQIRDTIFARLGIGESFTVPSAQINKWKAQSYYYGVRLKRKFCWRDQINGQHRCWRLL